jgi:peptide/nickel transport system permease protein
MRRALIRRLIVSVPLLLAVSLVTFVLLALTPGNAARTILGTSATPSQITALEKQLGLDQPLYAQYWHWLSQALHGNLGSSVFTGEPVVRILSSGLPITLTLVIAATAGSLLVGVPLGILSARRSGPTRHAVDVFSLAGFAIPSFWLGLLLVVVFAMKLKWFPPSGWVNPSVSLGSWARSLVLPVVTLTAAGAAVIAKQTRDGMLDVLSLDYIRALRARGISQRSIVYKHALRNALPNVVTLLGLYVVSLLLGTTLVENVFALQGLGSTAVQATSQHDLPVLEGAALYFTLIVVVTFTIVDLVRVWLNPKLRMRHVR